MPEDPGLGPPFDGPGEALLATAEPVWVPGWVAGSLGLRMLQRQDGDRADSGRLPGVLREGRVAARLLVVHALAFVTHELADRRFIGLGSHLYPGMTC